VFGFLILELPVESDVLGDLLRRRVEQVARRHHFHQIGTRATFAEGLRRDEDALFFLLDDADGFARHQFALFHHIERLRNKERISEAVQSFQALGPVAMASATLSR
jgi:ribosomal 50S subunit-associated protein YjgA (DUF615 family)